MSSETPRLAVPVGERDHIRGPREAPVTLVEFGDLECPYCGLAHPVLEEVRQRLGDELRFVYRHFPLVNIHPHAQPAAEAAEAAGTQGKFWPMHDRLFEHQESLEDRDLLAHAQVLGLDIVRFVGEIGAGVHVPRIRDDFMSGVRSGVNGTPTFFINGFRYDGSRDVASMIAAIQYVHAAT
jgi:protein-disulfide isomerase